MNTQQVAIVTAASRGIGAGCAREMAARGYKVALMARNKSIFDLAVRCGLQWKDLQNCMPSAIE